MKEKETAEVSEIVRRDIIPALESVNGVASVTGVGLLEEKIEVVISQEKIEELNEKILAKVDRELAQAEQQLQSARKKIEQGKARLAEENEKQTAKLDEGAQAIALARSAGPGEAQIAAGEPQLEQTIKVLQGALEVINYTEQADSAKENCWLKMS